MFVTLPREEAQTRLRAAGYSYSRTLNLTCEVWLRPGQEPIYLQPELDGEGGYEEVMILLAEAQARES